MAPTVVQIKSSLDSLGVTYKNTMRKGELLELLEKNQIAPDNDRYSPPFTRRRKTMSAVEVQEDRPLNPAGALLEKFDEEPESLGDEVDVKITRESSPIKESVLEEEVSEIVEESEVTGSEEEDGLITETVLTSVIENSPQGKIVTRSVTKRRSTRITRHAGCETALFSDEESVDVVEEAEANEPISTEGKSLRRILLLSIIIVLLANLIAYIHIHNPSMFSDCFNKVKNMFIEPNQAPSDVPTQ